MDFIFEITDRTGKRIRLTGKQFKHLKKHPHMNDPVELIKETIKMPTTIRYNEIDETIRFFYKEYKNMPPEERYLFVSVKYLNGEGFVITSFYTNKITGIKWKT